MIPRAPGVPVLGDAVHQDGGHRPLGTALHVEDAAPRALLHDFFLQQHQAVLYGLGAGRAPGDVHVHRHDLVNALDHAVNVVHAAAVGAGAHGHDPLGLRHLLVKPQHHRGDFFKKRAGDDQEVRLPGRAPEDLGPEPGQVVAGGKHRGHFDEAAGQAEKQRPQTVLPGPVDDQVNAAQDRVGLPAGALRYLGPQSSPPFCQR